MLQNLSWLGLKLGRLWGESPTIQQKWEITILALVMIFFASLVFSRSVKLFFALGAIAMLLSIGALADVYFG